MTEIELVREIDLRGFGGPEAFAWDVDGDGLTELVWLQDCGIFHSRLFSHHLGRWPHLRQNPVELFCVTATTAGGAVRWQHGAPYHGTAPYCAHCGEWALACADVDGDGVPEVVGVSHRSLLVLNGRTGALKRRTELPADNFSIVRLAHTGSGTASTGWTILVQNNEAAYPPHRYGQPALFYDAGTLRQLGARDAVGAGHYPLVFDADGDGRDEFLIGYELLDHDRQPLWTLDRFRSGEIAPERQHVDCARLRAAADGSWQVALATGDQLYLADHRGTTLWQRWGEHPQFCAFGRFRSNDSGEYLFLANCRFSMELFDLAGGSVWRTLLPEHWPQGRPASIPAGAGMHMGRPFSVWRIGEPGRPDAIVYNEAGWPYLVGGDGEPEFAIPCPPNARQPEHPLPRHRPDDYGYGYRTVVADLDGDGAEELLVHDRRFAWIFRCARRPRVA